MIGGPVDGSSKKSSDGSSVINEDMTSLDELMKQLVDNDQDDEDDE